jgi:hypothetical protein
LQNKNQVKLSFLALILFIKLESNYPLHTNKTLWKTQRKTQRKHWKELAFFKIGCISNCFENVTFHSFCQNDFKTKKMKKKKTTKSSAKPFFFIINISVENFVHMNLRFGSALKLVVSCEILSS